MTGRLCLTSPVSVMATTALSGQFFLSKGAKVSGIHRLTSAILKVKNTVLLQDRALHGLHNDAGCRVVDLRGLLVELLGEKIDAEVAVLAGGGRGRDTDDLARAALEQQNIAYPNVVAGNGNCQRRKFFRVSDRRSTSNGTAFPYFDHLAGLATLGVNDTVSHLVEAVAERVIVACVVGIVL